MLMYYTTTVLNYTNNNLNDATTMSEKTSDDDVVPVGETKQAQQEPEKEMTAEDFNAQQQRSLLR